MLPANLCGAPWHWQGFGSLVLALRLSSFCSCPSTFSLSPTLTRPHLVRPVPALLPRPLCKASRMCELARHCRAGRTVLTVQSVSFWGLWQEAEAFAKAASLPAHKGLVYTFLARTSTQKVQVATQQAAHTPTHTHTHTHTHTPPKQRAAHNIVACCWWPSTFGAIMELCHWQGRTTVSARGAAATARKLFLDCSLVCQGEGHHGRWPQCAPHEHRGGAGRRADGFWHRHSLPHRRHHGHP